LDLGAEFFRWEFATAVLGHCMGIDPFDQPDVQSAKDRTKAVLEALAKTGKLPEPPSQAKVGAASLSFSSACPAKELGALLAAKPGDYGALLAYLPSEGEFDEPLDELRRAMAEALGGAAVQLGYGPRYLHSTGQLHKGGGNNGVFILVMREKETPLPIAGSPYGFEQLVAAQAIGDFQALEAAGRRAVLIRLSGDAFAALEKAADAVLGAGAARK
ncbi:MAG TPA: transaldolase, partial [Elusimicrobiota bacterium]|nr:transaldolase [Elusimicrobiota bacterium]